MNNDFSEIDNYIKKIVEHIGGEEFKFHSRDNKPGYKILGSGRFTIVNDFNWQNTTCNEFENLYAGMYNNVYDAERDILSLNDDLQNLWTTQSSSDGKYVLLKQS